MGRQFNSDASRLRAAYLSSLLVVLYGTAVRCMDALVASASQPAPLMGQRRISASSWGKL